jgi:hypothetical protein
MRQGVVVGVVSLQNGRVGIGVGEPVSAAGRSAGQMAVSQALSALPAASPERHRALILLTDGVTGNAVDVVRGAAAEAGSGLTWAGGGAGDNLRFLRTVQYARGRALRDSAVAIAIEMPQCFGAGIRHGWRPYGPPTMVTRVRGATVLELEYEQAFDVYRRAVEHRGDQVTQESFASFAMTHPLGIPQADGEHVIRDPLAVAPDGGLTFVAEVPDGSLVRVMEGDCAALLGAARAAALQARGAVPGELGGAFVFDCVSRAMMLGDQVGEELAAFRAGLGASVPMMGGLTFGEVGALNGGVPQFHNKTAVLLALPAGG